MMLLLIFIFFLCICWISYKPNLERNANGDWMLFYWWYNERKYKIVWRNRV